MEKLKSFIQSLDFNSISAERKAILTLLRTFIQTRISNEEDISLTFICTHNSRRSHFGQVWAMVAAEHFGVKNIKTFSGGTQATACNIRTITALTRAGFEINSNGSNENPTYAILYNHQKAPIKAFSKVFDSPENPNENFAAIMTCDSANDNCPFIPGALVRIPILYIDPKVSDDSEREIETYDERCYQIAMEMFWVFSEL